MNEETKLLKHHLQTINLLNFEERKKLMNKYLKVSSYREISRDTNIPVSTLHEYASERNLYRSEKTIKDIGTTNQKLLTILKLFKTITKIDNTIAIGYMKQIKEEIRRIKENE